MCKQNECRNMVLSVSTMVFCAVLLASAAPGDTVNYTQSFDGVTTGALPAGWLAGSTNSIKPLNTWKVQTDPAAPSPAKVLVLANIVNKTSKFYNVCYTPDVIMQDGTIEVKIRGDSGAVDQGGGIIWRVQDFDNYCLVRYNPLEKDIRCYYVKNAVRKEPPLLIVPNQTIGSRVWFTLKIRNIGSTIEVFLNGVKKGQYTDGTFTQPGGVGIWSKADAASSFDDYTVTGNLAVGVRPQARTPVVAFQTAGAKHIVSIQRNGPGRLLIKHPAGVTLLNGQRQIPAGIR